MATARYYRDLREFLVLLEQRGKLHRFNRPVNKDTELGPLLTIQLRAVPEAERKVLLFEDVRGARGEHYAIRVAGGVYGASEEIGALGLGCETAEEAGERWRHGLANPIPPVIVDRGPVQEVAQIGAELEACGLDAIPAPIEQPGFSQIIRTGMPMITRDPETGIRNVGTYNGFLRDRTRICAGIAPSNHAMRYHWQTAKRRGEDLPLAIVVGGTPNVMAVGSSSIPYGVDELAVAGGMAGAPVELVRCKSIPLEAPAHAEIVIEGYLSTKLLEPRFAFGEYPGYMSMERNNRPVMTVTAITHRGDAIFTPILVGYPYTDSGVSHLCSAQTLLYRLRVDCALPVEQVHMHNGGAFCVVRLREGAGRDAWQVLHGVATIAPYTKYIIAVDSDINPRDLDVVSWAMTWRVRPERDIVVMPGRAAGLDPSFGTTGSSRGRMDQTDGTYYRVVVDATLPGPYPPVALPRREYMERALDIWREEAGLPTPQPRAPWYGYELGFWSQEDQEIAELLVRGDYRAVGRIAAGMQVEAG